MQIVHRSVHTRIIITRVSVRIKISRGELRDNEARPGGWSTRDAGELFASRERSIESVRCKRSICIVYCTTIVVCCYRKFIEHVEIVNARFRLFAGRGIRERCD